MRHIILTTFSRAVLLALGGFASMAGAQEVLPFPLKPSGSTAMCSPTRGALLTGRNHQFIGAGQIAEFANDWDGYSGTQTKSSAMMAEVLKDYGYATAAFGKWHNTPALDTSAKGPFEYWPAVYGFEYFYGFLGGEASQYEPNLVRNTTSVHPNKPKDGKPYHLTEDIADDAIAWLREHKAFQPDKPFFMYWVPGAAHGPHQVPKAWADKYQGKFDDGWDKYRERVFIKAKVKGWIPQNTKLTPRPDTLPSWDSIPSTIDQHLKTLKELGGLDVLGTAKTDNHYNAACAWAGSVPLVFTSNDCLDIGTDLGSPVSPDYYDQAPFKFNGKIEAVKVKYLGTPAELEEEKKQMDAKVPALD